MFADTTKIVVSTHALKQWRKRIGSATDKKIDVERAARRSKPLQTSFKKKLVAYVKTKWSYTLRKRRFFFLNKEANAVFLMAADVVREFTVVTCFNMDVVLRHSEGVEIMKHYAFQIFDREERLKLEATTNPAMFFNLLRDALNAMNTSGNQIEYIEVGQVDGKDESDAKRKANEGAWIEGTHGQAYGVS